MFQADDIRFMEQLRQSSSLSPSKDVSLGQPPSFYDEDLMKYKVKFQKAIAMRREYKK